MIYLSLLNFNHLFNQIDNILLIETHHFSNNRFLSGDCLLFDAFSVYDNKRYLEWYKNIIKDIKMAMVRFNHDRSNCLTIEIA